MHHDDDNAQDAGTRAVVQAAINADNLALRKRFFALVACYSLDEVRAKFGPELADSDRTICVERDGERRYPCFQFGDTGVLPTIEAALRCLPSDMSRWQVAFWFVASNPWLDGRAPCDVLDDAEQLIFAAERESGPIG